MMRLDATARSGKGLLTLGSAMVLTMLLTVGFSVFGMQRAVDWMQPAGELFAAGLLAATAVKTRLFRWCWIHLALACGCYGVADVVWNVLEFQLGLDPGEMIVFQAVYLLPNLLLVASIWMYVRRFMHLWNMVQMSLDIGLFLVVTMDFIWGFFFRDWYGAAGFGDLFGIYALLYVLADLFAIVIVASYAGLVKMKDTSAAVRILAAGYVVYIVADLIYSVQLYRDAYVPGAWTDMAYSLALMSLGIAGLFGARDARETVPARNRDAVPENVRWKPYYYLLLFNPVLLQMVIGVRGVDVAITISAVLLHLLLTGFNQIAVKNAHLAERERGLVSELELEVASRTARLIAMNRDLENMAYHDQLTGLPNRRRFQERLEEMLQGGEVKHVALLCLNIDRFKHVNDAYGQEIGDRVLQIVALRLSGQIGRSAGKDAMIGRFSGDEFLIALPGMHDDARIGRIAELLLNDVCSPIEIVPWSFALSASVGLAIWPIDAESADRLAFNANAAMLDARQANGRHYARYSALFGQRMRRRHELETAMRGADFDQEFHLVYQPQFRCGDGSLIGMEALMRWHSPTLGVVTPCEFIPVAEDSGLIAGLGDWAARQALRQIADWNGRFGLSLRMGINFSPKQFDVSGFIEGLSMQMKTCGVLPEWVDAEITESVAMSHETSAEERLTALSGIGVSISVDDFGTGYSSLSYIKRFDIDALKIAKPLVDTVAEDAEQRQIVRAIIMMAEAMNLRTIAEGVETQEQFETLRRLGCGEIQGYLLGRPETAERFETVHLAAELRRRVLSPRPSTPPRSQEILSDSP